MLTAKVEIESGEVLEITGHEDLWQLTSVDGLDPSKGKITTKDLANWDGSVYTDSRIEERDITLELYINGKSEDNRDKLFSFFKVSKWVKLYLTTDNRDVSIEGYVETAKIDIFKQHQVIQIDILCPSSFFVSRFTQTQQLSNTLGGFYFPFAIEKEGIEFASFEEGKRVMVINYGEFTTGVKFEFNFKDDCTDPMIYDRQSGEYMLISSSFIKGDVLLIDTTRGKRRVIKKDGDLETNLIGSLDIASTWLQLKPGRTYFSLKATSGVNAINVMIYNNIYYQGL